MQSLGDLANEIIDHEMKIKETDGTPEEADSCVIQCKDKPEDPRELAVIAQEFKRFDIDDPSAHEAIKKHLDEYGFVVISNVADESQIKRAKNSFWEFCEALIPDLRRDDSSTWENRNWPPNPSNGIFCSYGFNHSEFCWNTRILPKVKKSFSVIWGSDSLVTSFDAGNAFRPWKRNPLWLTMNNWWHVDQNALKGPSRRGRVCVQGLVTYYDADETSGGLCVIPGSHNLHDEICSRAPSARALHDFVRIQPDDPILSGIVSEKGILIRAKAGDLILWDSRTVHCNTHSLDIDNFNPAEVNIGNHNELIRLVSYVCMLPRSTCTQEVIESRKRAFLSKTPTSHWPNIHVESFYRKDYDSITKSEITREILDLVGYDRDETPTSQLSNNPQSYCTIQ